MKEDRIALAVLSMIPDLDAGEQPMPVWRIAYLMGIKPATVMKKIAYLRDEHLSHKPILTTGKGKHKGTFLSWDDTKREEKLEFERKYIATRDRRIRQDGIEWYLKNNS